MDFESLWYTLVGNLVLEFMVYTGRKSSARLFNQNIWKWQGVIFFSPDMGRSCTDEP